MAVNLTNMRGTQHICAVTNVASECLADLCAFSQAGLERNQQSVYVASETPREEVLAAAQRAGITTEVIASGQFTVIPYAQLQRQLQRHNPIDFFRQLCSASRNSGFRALRIAIEMGWILKLKPDVANYQRYEASLEGFLRETKISCICQYSRNTVPAECIRHAMMYHPLVFYSGTLLRNRYAVPQTTSNPEQAHLGNLLERSRELEQLEGELQKLTFYRRLMAGVVHELKNPLQALQEVLYLLEQKNGTVEKTQRYVEMGKQEVERMQHVIDHTLGISRQMPRLVPLKLVDVINAVLQFYDHKIKYKHIHIERQYRSDGSINAVAAEMRQVITNLIINALEAVQTGGIITVRVHPSRDWRDARHGYRVLISDNGTGVAREHLARLFEGFFTTKDEKGSGLGLWVSAGIVEQHEGRIRVRSRIQNPRQGTTFMLFLPCQRQAPGSVAR